MNTTLENAKQHSAAMSAQILSTQAQQIDAIGAIVLKRFSSLSLYGGSLWPAILA
jgi:hypothetical protein